MSAFVCTKTTLLVLALNGVTTGNRTQIAGTTNPSNNRYTIATIYIISSVLVVHSENKIPQ